MRLAVAIVVSVLVTLALFWFMQFLIGGQEGDLQKPEDRMNVEIVRVKRDEETQERQREPPQPPQPEERPPPPPMQQQQQLRPDLGGIGIGAPAADTGLAGGLGLGNLQEGDPIPVAAIPPQYPRDALMQGLAGWVRVEFTINPDGSVSDARVVDAHPRRGIFDREALRAIVRWRFKPKVQDGEAISSRAGYTIDFKMDGA
ncbi:MAG: energy transducer TonB [Gammaproteobacteria bacterium]